MFGRDTDDSTDNNDQMHLAPADDVAIQDDDQPQSDDHSHDDQGHHDDHSDASNYIMTDAPGGTPDAPPPPDQPAESEPSEQTPAETAPAEEHPTSLVPPSTRPSETTGGDSSDLNSIKQQALQQLSPLLSHLDLNPEEKFRTTMMMLQATDNPDLVKDAYDAAQGITDDKTRAQALLDVVNEINYFNQQKH